MSNLDMDALRVQSGQAVLARRADAVRYLEQARVAGKAREVRQYEAIVKSLDKLIAQYGLNRYA